jgi:N-methylhydantoinase B
MRLRVDRFHNLWRSHDRPRHTAVVRGALGNRRRDGFASHPRCDLAVISETNDCARHFPPDLGRDDRAGALWPAGVPRQQPFTVTNIIKLVGQEGGFKPGDLWIVNDPYVSGTHLQDIVLISPYFVDGELFALLASTGHWMDIGGSVPGGWAPKATEIHQEGIIIPPMKLYDAGKLNEPLVKMFTSNVRLPDQIAGDLSAMCNVFNVGRRGPTRCSSATAAACRLHHRDDGRSGADALHIAEIPDGAYRSRFLRQ